MTEWSEWEKCSSLSKSPYMNSWPTLSDKLPGTCYVSLGLFHDQNPLQAAHVACKPVLVPAVPGVLWVTRTGKHSFSIKDSPRSQTAESMAHKGPGCWPWPGWGWLKWSYCGNGTPSLGLSRVHGSWHWCLVPLLQVHRWAVDTGMSRKVHSCLTKKIALDSWNLPRLQKPKKWWYSSWLLWWQPKPPCPPGRGGPLWGHWVSGFNGHWALAGEQQCLCWNRLFIRLPLHSSSAETKGWLQNVGTLDSLPASSAFSCNKRGIQPHGITEKIKGENIGKGSAQRLALHRCWEIPSLLCPSSPNASYFWHWLSLIPHPTFSGIPGTLPVLYRVVCACTH